MPKQKKHVVDPHNELDIYFRAKGYIEMLKAINDGRTIHRRGNVMQALVSFCKLAELKDWKSLEKIKPIIEKTFDESYRIVKEHEEIASKIMKKDNCDE